MTSKLGFRPLKGRHISSKSQDMLSKASRPSPGSNQPPTRLLTRVVGDVMLSIYLLPVPMLRIRGIVPPFPYTPSWRARCQLYFIYTL